jgi:hypothetical protein
MPSTFEFCLPTSAASVPDRPVWLHEVKYDVVKVVCTEILNSGVVVMESAKEREGFSPPFCGISQSKSPSLSSANH